MGFKLDLTKTSDQQFYAFLSAESQLAITAADVTFSAPTPDTSVADTNTQVTLTAVAGSGLVKGNPIQRNYNRVDLNDAMAGIGKSPADLNIMGDVAAWKAGIGPATATINSLFGSTMSTADFTTSNGADSTDGDGKAVYTVDVTVRADHMGLVGKLTFVVTDNVDHSADMATAFPNNKMDGFDTPTAS